MAVRHSSESTSTSIRGPLLPFLLSFSLSLSLSLLPLAASRGVHLPAALRGASLRRSDPYNTKIEYFGGPVLGHTGPVTVHLIYYGHWSTASGRKQQSLIRTFVQSLSGGSGQQGDGGVPSVQRWWGSVTQYYGEENNGTKYRVNPDVRLGKTVFDNYSQGKYWRNDSHSVWAAVERQLHTGSLPVDPEGIYVVLVSPDMAVDGLCSLYCGWHSTANHGRAALAHALVTDANMCPDGCGFSSAAGPSRTGGMEGTVNILAHELMEAVTDPDTIAGWVSTSDYYADNAEEIGDLCVVQPTGLGQVFPPKAQRNGTYVYNLVGLGDTPFAIQEVWSRVTQSCQLQAHHKGNGTAPKPPPPGSPTVKRSPPRAPSTHLPPSMAPSPTPSPAQFLAPASVTPLVPAAGVLALAPVGSPMQTLSTTISSPPGGGPIGPAHANGATGCQPKTVFANTLLAAAFVYLLVFA